MPLPLKSLLSTFLLLFYVTRLLAGTPPKTTSNNTEAIPPSGLGATTIGERVLLLSDGSWKIDNYYREDKVSAITDHGRTVSLTRKLDPNSQKPILIWEYSDQSTGPIQILVSRAIDTGKSIHSNTDNCIPVITARNLSKLSLFRVIAELSFQTSDGNIASTSVMLGPLDQGEEEEKVTSPIYVDKCQNLTAMLHIPYCYFSNGLDCTNTVETSRYGTIPVQLAPKPSL
ncbi:MAG: hypothetical protein P8179_13140 [Candidatus Thiodiazotropha sp.]|jgi:hypothetical protein